MRAVLYARFSSELQREASIEDQIRLCREKVERDGGKVVQVYSDKAVSGGSLLRPAIQALMQDAEKDRFDAVVAEALDRLSRDQVDIAMLYRRFKFLRIRIITLAEGEIGDLHVGLKGTMNQLFLTDLADKTRRGLRGRVEAGRSGGGNSFGYDVIRETGPDGTLVGGKRRINDAEAAVVRRIFEDFAAGKSPRRIAFELNAEGIVGPRGAGWTASTINGNAARGTGILNNELYIGRLVWNRLRYVKNPDTGKRISRANEEAALVVKDVPELRIIDQPLWDKVKTRQQAVKRDTRPDCAERRPFWERTRPRYLFSGLMRCGACGGAYAKISANLFGCATARNKGTCVNRLNIRRDVLEAMVLEGLQERLMDPDLFKIFAEEFHAEVNRLRSKEGGRTRDMKMELDRVERRIRKLVSLITEDDAPVRSLKQELVELEARQEVLQQKMTQADAPAPVLHPNLSELYRRKVATLRSSLSTPDRQPEAAELVRSLVDAIILTPENGTLRLDIEGELAGILALCQAARAKEPGSLSTAELAKQIKMVAGRGFEPLTFRL
jgi:site-specific DNA recombinase